MVYLRTMSKLTEGEKRKVREDLSKEKEFHDIYFSTIDEKTSLVGGARTVDISNLNNRYRFMVLIQTIYSVGLCITNNETYAMDTNVENVLIFNSKYTFTGLLTNPLFMINIQDVINDITSICEMIEVGEHENIDCTFCRNGVHVHIKLYKNIWSITYEEWETTITQKH